MRGGDNQYKISRQLSEDEGLSGTVINTWTYEKQSLFLISGVIDDLLSVNEQIGLSSYTQTKFPLLSQLELAGCGLTIPLSSGVKIALS